MKRLSDEAVRVLGSLQVEGNVAAITAGQLERAITMAQIKRLKAPPNPTKR